MRKNYMLKILENIGVYNTGTKQISLKDDVF